MVRIATVNDAEQLNILNDEFNGESETSIDNIRNSLMNNKQEVVIVADEDDMLVGFVCVQLKKSFCYDEYMPEITEVYVKPAYRKRGLASEMITFAEAYCSKNYPLHQYELLTGQENLVAQTVYNKLGYVDDNELHLSKRVKTERVYTRSATYQKFEVLKTNRNKRYKYGEFFVEATCLYCGKDGSLWIGTRSGGLLRYHPQQGFRSYTLRDGFASNEIAGITQDPQGNTWVATSYGLSLITASTERVTTYFQSDRLQTQQFYPHCSLNTSAMIYFGGNTGLAQFAPGRVIPKITKSPVPLVLTEIRINSIVQHPSEGKVLTKPLNDTKRIVLNHKQRNIDINYEAVTFLSPLH